MDDPGGGQSVQGDRVREDVGLVGLVPDNWSPFWQTRHHVMTRLADHFRVVWMEPAETLRDRFRRSARTACPLAVASDRFEVYRPEWYLPRLYWPKATALWTLRRRLRRAVDRLRSRGCETVVLYVWRPEFLDVLDLVAHDGLVYHIDDEYSFSAEPHPISGSEHEMLMRADQVIIHSEGLMERKGRINPHTVRIPNGADVRGLSRVQREPADLAAIPRPRVGYCGYLKRQIDWPLMLELAKRHPELSFVFVGRMNESLRSGRPDDHEDLDRIEQLDRLGHVHFLGGKTSLELTAYPQHLDVCLLPYRLNEYTHCIYPMKLHEYLAAERPVVSTPIQSVLGFSPLVRVARSVEDWSLALREATLPEANSAEARAERLAVARRHDWDLLVDRIADVLIARFGGPPDSPAS